MEKNNNENKVTVTSFETETTSEAEKEKGWKCGLKEAHEIKLSEEEIGSVVVRTVRRRKKEE